MGRKIKYMGSSDIHFIDAGENWSGELAEPLSKRVQWDWDNNHVVDAEEAGLSDEALELLLEDSENFRDVTDLKRVPRGQADKLWRGQRDNTNTNLVSAPPPPTGASDDEDAEEVEDVPAVEIKGEQNSGAASAPTATVGAGSAAAGPSTRGTTAT